MRQLSLLIVDDHPAMVNAVRRHWRRLPWLHIAGSASNGREAVDACRQLKPDAVVMDFSMPVMDGLQAASLIKALADIPYVVITSHYDDDAHREHALAAGADAFISKAGYFDQILPLLEKLATSLGVDVPQVPGSPTA